MITRGYLPHRRPDAHSYTYFDADTYPEFHAHADTGAVPRAAARPLL